MEPRTTIPDLWLEQYLLGELSAEKAAQIAALEQSDPEVRARIEALRSSTTAILKQYPPRVVAGGVKQRLDRQHRPVFSAQWLAVAGPALAAVALVVWLAHDPGTGQQEPPGSSPHTQVPGRPKMVDPGTRLKGEPSLLLYRVGRAAEGTDLRAGATPDTTGQEPASEADPLDDGSVAAAGDLIQIKYRASGAPFGMLLSIDGRGVVTLHHPVFERDDTALPPGPAASLSRSYELDDAPNFERFILVTSDEPVPVSEVLALARTLGADPLRPLPLPVGLAQKSVLLRKAGEAP